MNNPIKVFWNGKRLKDIYPHATRWQVLKFKLNRLFRKTMIIVGGVAMVVVLVELGGNLNPKIIYNQVEAVEVVPPVLQRIAGCESGNGAKSQGSHYDKNGQVLLRANTNKTVDVGKYQINSVWFKKATELGFDITKEQDNEEMAKWIYENKGTGDWSATANCWK